MSVVAVEEPFDTARPFKTPPWMIVVSNNSYVPTGIDDIVDFVQQ